MMKKVPPAASPDAYVRALKGWQRAHVENLRAGVLAAAQVEETIKWGNLVYFANGPAIVIRAEDTRVLLGFWRGKRMRAIEPRLKPGGKYDMATIELKSGDTLSPAIVRKL